MNWIDHLDMTCGGARLREAKLKRLKMEEAMSTNKPNPEPPHVWGACRDALDRLLCTYCANHVPGANPEPPAANWPMGNDEAFKTWWGKLCTGQFGYRYDSLSPLDIARKAFQAGRTCEAGDRAASAPAELEATLRGLVADFRDHHPDADPAVKRSYDACANRLESALNRVAGKDGGSNG